MEVEPWSIVSKRLASPVTGPVVSPLWVAFKRNQNSTFHTLCLLFFARLPMRYYSHFAGKKTEAKILSDLCKVLQLLVVALGSEAIWFQVRASLGKCYFLFFCVLPSFGRNVPGTWIEKSVGFSEAVPSCWDLCLLFVNFHGASVTSPGKDILFPSALGIHLFEK